MAKPSGPRPVIVVVVLVVDDDVVVVEGEQFVRGTIQYSASYIQFGVDLHSTTLTTGQPVSLCLTSVL